MWKLVQFLLTGCFLAVAAIAALYLYYVTPGTHPTVVQALLGGVLVAHEAAALLAVVCGAMAMLGPRGSNGHIDYGYVYLYCTGFVCFSAFPLTAYHPNAALLELSVVAFGLAYTGKRWIHGNWSQAASTPDGIARALLMLSAVPACGFGCRDMLAGQTTQGIAAILLGLAAFLVGLVESRWKQLDWGERMPVHIYHVLGSYALILTIIPVLALPSLPLALRWFAIPGLAGCIMLYYRLTDRLLVARDWDEVNRRYGPRKIIRPGKK